MTKIGMKKYPSPIQRQRTLKPVSKKQAKENAELKKLTDKLRELNKFGDSEFYLSELSWSICGKLEPHHLAGRGKNLVNPFTIIMIGRFEHLVEQKHMSYEHKQELINKIRPIRLAQGFKLEDYE